LALYLIIDNDDRHAVGEWFYITWLYEIALGITIGIIIGYSVRKIMKFSERKGLIDRQSFVAQYVSLSILVIGTSTSMSS
jgi:NhaP-type Na+/H+ or K+/H+ antiporter